jgi:hypothetical protein
MARLIEIKIKTALRVLINIQNDLSSPLVYKILQNPEKRAKNSCGMVAIC